MHPKRRSFQYRPRLTAVLAWLRLARISQQIDLISAQHVRAHHLTMAQFDVLAQIGAAEGRSQQELAEALFVTKGNISQILGRMEQDGLVRRSQEGRANYLYLTEAGRALYHAVVPAQERTIAGLFAPLSDAEQDELLRLLRKLDHGLRASRTPPEPH
jgi:DNA-binding MarR family transcriptional regulator